MARPLATDELEGSKRWEVGRTARTWIGLDKIKKLIGITRADFSHYRSTVVGRTVAESGFDFEEVRRKVVRVFIFDRSAVMTKTAEADMIPIRMWKEFEELYVSKYNTDPTVFDYCVFQQRQLKSNRGTHWSFLSPCPRLMCASRPLFLVGAPTYRDIGASSTPAQQASGARLG